MDLLEGFSVGSLFAGLVFGVLGMWLIKRGKSEAHIPFVVIGLVLIVYPYFITNVYLVWAIGVGLLFVAKRLS